MFKVGDEVILLPTASGVCISFHRFGERATVIKVEHNLNVFNSVSKHSYIIALKDENWIHFYVEDKHIALWKDLNEVI